MSNLTMQPTVIVNGREWQLFAVDYDTADGKFTFYMYALAYEHALIMLEELKATAHIGGQVCEFVK